MNIEPLETRTAPAAVLHYTDIDGDLVSVAVSKAATPAEIAAICTFSDPDADDPRILRKIDFSANAALFAGTNLTISVKRGPGLADGLANIGAIDATSLDGSGFALNLGAIKIAGDLGRVNAGTGSADIPAVKSLTVRSMGRLGLATQLPGGDLRTELSGSMGALTVQRDVAEAFIRASDIRSITIGGSLLGGAGDDSGRILLSTVGAVKIGGSIFGGSGVASGRFSVVGDIPSLTLGGSIFGGSGNSSGSVATGDIGSLKIGGDVRGGTNVFSGYLTAKNIAKATIGGSLIGGSSSTTGEIESNGTIGSIRIGHDLIAGFGNSSGAIEAEGLGSATVGGSLLGGQFDSSTHDTAGAIVVGGGGITGLVKIGGNVQGAATSGGAFAKLTGAISSEGRIAGVIIGGSLLTGTDASNATNTLGGGIFANDDIGAITIKGSVVGHAGAGFDPTPAIIAARGQDAPGAVSDVAIGRITISGRAERLQILAGYDETLVHRNADAQIGAVTVGGDWVESSIAAGAINFGNDDASGGTGNDADNVNFGNTHDFKIPELADNAAIFSRIASITIGGQIFGTQALVLDRFGFVAEEIAAFKVGGLKVPLTNGEHNDGFILVGPFNDVRLHELLTP